MKRRFLFIKLVVFIIIVLIIFQYCTIDKKIVIAKSSKYVLKVETIDKNNKKVLILKQRLSPGDNFSIKWINSVQLSPVEEIFTINENGEIVLTQVIFEDFGVGVPELDSGSKFLIRDGKIILYEINEIISSISMKVSYLHDHFLVISGRQINLRNILLGGDLVKINLLAEDNRN